jgi:hypothetical protein
MLTYDELVELASLCAHNARIATSKDVADELWRMAREYQDQAARLGETPEIGDKRRQRPAPANPAVVTRRAHSSWLAQAPASDSRPPS